MTSFASREREEMEDSRQVSLERGLVSVMMPAYNAERYIGQAIESLFAQTYPIWELVVVNDGSTDNTVDAINRYLDRRVRLIQKENGGEASARNIALQHLRGEFLAFLDADDVYLPQHLELAIRHLQSHPEQDGLYTDGHYCDSSGNLLQTLSSRRRGPFEGDIFEEVVRSSDVFGPPVCVVLRSEPICRHKLDFDPRIVIGPDWDFLTRFSEYSRFGNLRDFTCMYRLHGTNVTFRVDMQKRASYLVLCREKAIKLLRFKECSLQVRSFAFYDLLVNLLTGFPERQAEILQWPEFYALPTGSRAQIVRVMASEALIRGSMHSSVGDWISLSRKWNPYDRRSAWLDVLYRLHPGICQVFLRLKAMATSGRQETSLFGKLGSGR